MSPSEALRQAGDQSRARKDLEARRLRDEVAEELRPVLERELRPRLEGEVRLQLEKGLRAQLDKEAALERERAQARAQDLERQVREMEGIIRKRQLQHQSSSDLPCSSPARERQLQLQVEQLQRDLEVRRGAERQVQEQLQAAEQRAEEQVQQLQRQLAERRAAERQLQEQLQSAEEQLQERHSGASKVQAHLQTVKAKYEDLVSSLEQQLSAARQEIADLKDKVAAPSSASSEAGEACEADGLPLRDEPRHPRDKAGGAAPKRRPRRSQSVGEPSPCPTPSTGQPPASTTASTEILVMPHQQNRPAAPQRPDTHLLATIRGLQHELQTKEKEMAKLNRELSDARATNRRLQQERQRLLNEASPLRPKDAKDAKDTAKDAKASAAAVDADTAAENRGLRRDVQRLQEDLLSLHAKRVNDLTRLQAKHEEELESVVCERVNERLSDRSCEGRVAELQGQLYTQQLVIAHLKEQLKHSEHGGEEVALLKRERDQLEKSVAALNKQVSRLKEDVSPDARRMAALQDQVDDLEARHESRERKLQAIVRDLLQQRQGQGQGQGQGDDEPCCSASVRLLHKNRDLCFYRAQMDRLLDALRELERSRRGSSS